LARKTVGDPNVFVPDDQTARQPLIFVLANVVAILVKDLNSLILTVRYPELAFRIYGDPMSFRELTWLGPSATPSFDEFSVLIELEDARVAAIAFRRVPLNHEDVAVAAEG